MKFKVKTRIIVQLLTKKKLGIRVGLRGVKRLEINIYVQFKPQ